MPKTPSFPPNRCAPKKIQEVAIALGLDPEIILPHGHFIAKIPFSELEKRQDQPDGRLILVSAMSPTPTGEGKTTTTIGLGDALCSLGHNAAICIREPSLGPYFGIKGGGTGSGKAQVVPAEDINLHFVGDMYSVSKANNLLAAMLDNHLQHGNELGIDPRRIVWRRVIDLNDRALREIIVGLGGVKHGVPRKDGFNITPASEVMAILCLAHDYADLGKRLSNIVVAFTQKGQPITASDLQAAGAMQVLLRDAIHPNLVQTLESTPAFVHAGPFANIAQGTNSAIATRTALKLADYVVTEAGFGTELGAEKFFDIKCRIAGLQPQGVVIVATVKAIEYHGGFDEEGGLGNLAKHIQNIQLFGLKPVVAINHFTGDRQSDIDRIIDFCASKGVEAVAATHWKDGGKGAHNLAQATLRAVEANKRKRLKFLYPLESSIKQKIETIARKLYGAQGVDYDSAAEAQAELLEQSGYGQLPVCIAKTPLSLSDDPKRHGRPRNFRIKVNELRISAGAGFVVVICGNIMTMPGLPKVPAAANIKVLDSGEAVGLS
ncbi:MAG TPA: formate--tetrahydrofolate ligase [Verrucomicrobia bacterium]|jgi:formate--tetrahydrofolate ligase|nr:formate--tetrahydrofolate ligase [Verrucomicrobiota bacterium]